MTTWLKTWWEYGWRGKPKPPARPRFLMPMESLKHDFPFEFKLHYSHPMVGAEEWCKDQFGNNLTDCHAESTGVVAGRDRPFSEIMRRQTYTQWPFLPETVEAARWESYYREFYFKSEADAVLFKLRWG